MSPSFTRSAAPALFFIVFAFTLGACSSPHPPAIAIAHVTVIDTTGGAPLPDFSVVIQGSRILAVGPSTTTAIPRGATLLDGTGKFLIPGLADMHIHLTGAGEPSGSREFIIPLLVANGVTAVRDMGGNVAYLKALRFEINSGKRVGPQIFFTGPYLDGYPPSFQPSIVVETPAEATAAVQKLKGEGVDFVKVQSGLQPEPYYAIARESERQNIRFIGHVPDSITAADASRAGQASIEHLTGVLLGCSTREGELRQRKLELPPLKETDAQVLARNQAWTKDLLDSYSQQKAADLFQKFCANHTWQVPTLPLLIHLAYQVPGSDRRGDPRLKYIPRDVRENWDKTQYQTFDSHTEADFALRRCLVKQSLAAVKAMKEAGVSIMAGTDAAAPNVFPGFSLHEDLFYFVEAGLTPMQALQAATIRPAEFLGRSAEQGTIEAGKRADLVLLDANPLDDIRNTQRIQVVVVNGQIIGRSDLDALLTRVERFAATH